MELTPEQLALVKAAQNRQMKKRGLPSDQSVEELVRQGVPIDLPTYKKMLHERKTAIGAQGKRDHEARMTRQRKAWASNIAADQARKFPGMSDDQIIAWTDAALAEAHRVLIALGAIHTGDSPTTESRYYTLDGHKVRLSAHTLPDSDERAHAGMHGDPETHITLRRYRALDTIEAWISEQLT